MPLTLPRACQLDMKIEGLVDADVMIDALDLDTLTDFEQAEVELATWQNRGRM